LLSTEVLISGPVQTIAGKQFLATHPEILVPQSSTEGVITTQRNLVNTDDTTRLIPLTSVPTSAKELTTRLGVTDKHSPSSHFLRTSPSPTTTVSTAEELTPKSTTFPAQSTTQSPMALSPPTSGKMYFTNTLTARPCSALGAAWDSGFL
jgi:hypothetical protein